MGLFDNRGPAEIFEAREREAAGKAVAAVEAGWAESLARAAAADEAEAGER